MRRLFVLDSRCADNTQDCRQSGNLSQCSAKCDTISHRAIQGGSHRRLVTALMWYQLLQQMTVVCYSAAGHCWLCWYCWPLLQEVFKYWNICLFSERKKKYSLANGHLPKNSTFFHLWLVITHVLLWQCSWWPPSSAVSICWWPFLSIHGYYWDKWRACALQNLRLHSEEKVVSWWDKRHRDFTSIASVTTYSKYGQLPLLQVLLDCELQSGSRICNWAF